MNDGRGQRDPEAPDDILRQLGLDSFFTQMETLQGSLDKVAQGMGALGENAQRQTRDTDNMAAHVLAMEAILAVMLRQMPINIEDVRAEVRRRTGAGDDANTESSDIVMHLAENLIKGSED